MTPNLTTLTIGLNELYELIVRVTDLELQDKLIAKRDELQAAVNAMQPEPELTNILDEE
jgi:hypothetical protein